MLWVTFSDMLTLSRQEDCAMEVRYIYSRMERKLRIVLLHSCPTVKETWISQIESTKDIWFLSKQFLRFWAAGAFNFEFLAFLEIFKKCKFKNSRETNKTNKNPDVACSTSKIFLQSIKPRYWYLNYLTFNHSLEITQNEIKKKDPGSVFRSTVQWS